MKDLDMLYDYYKDNNMAAMGYAAMASRVKDDKLEKLFMDLTTIVLKEGRETANMLIRFGGEIM